MGRIVARRHVKAFIRNLVLVIVGYVWVLFWFCIVLSITDDPRHSGIISQATSNAPFFFVMLMGLVPLGLGLIRVFPR
jgi:hypothetical protein